MAALEPAAVENADGLSKKSFKITRRLLFQRLVEVYLLVTNTPLQAQDLLHHLLVVRNLLGSFLDSVQKSVNG